MKKGVFFSIDALIALIIIFLSLLVIFPLVRYSPSKYFIHEDILKALSSLKIGELKDDPYIAPLIANGKITDLNKTFLEQIGEFYVTDPNLAKGLAAFFLKDVSETENIGIWYGDKLLASKNVTKFEEAKNIEVDRRIISGIKEGTSVTGFSSRAFLRNSIKTKYFYFGGYVGEGNISWEINYTGELDNVKIEITANKDFDIYINNKYSGRYQKSDSDFTPKEYNLMEGYKSYFNSGKNIIKFVNDPNPTITEDLHIAGGYVKITYRNSSVYEYETSRYYFPGVEGVINVYDGFYIPADLNSLNIFLRYKSEIPIFLNIGNVSVFDGKSSVETQKTIDNAELSSKLDYSKLSRKTIPLRLGTINASYVVNRSVSLDVFSVSPLPSSFNSQGGIKLITDANREFIKKIIPYETIYIGLVGISKDSIEAQDYHNLSRNETSLNNTLNNWNLKGGVCLCCGIENATKALAVRPVDNLKSIVLMSDNEPTGACVPQGPGATQDAIDFACNAYRDYGIVFSTILLYDIGLSGQISFSEKGKNMLQKIANCSNGSYYEGDYENMTEIYKNVAEDLLKLIYREQTIRLLGLNRSSILYPDSYIEMGYERSMLPYGLIINLEQEFSDSYSGNFSIPKNSTLVDANVISYSGARWTSYVNVSNKTVYNLTYFGNNFVELGDPYSVNIPNSFIQENNSVILKTGYVPYNYSEGSKSNKILYRVSRSVVTYSPISLAGEGCNWTIGFEDETSSFFNVPWNYTGTNYCYYNNSRIEYNENDAIQDSTYSLLKELDLDSDGKVDIKFSEQDLEISSSQIVGIPFSWSTEVQVRKWE